jgi:hypothetical protein
VAGDRDVVDDDVKPHLTTDPDDRAVDVIHLQRSPLDDQRELWHL